MKIALIHNLKPAVKDSSLPPDYYSECDSKKTIESIAKALEGGGHTVIPVEADRNLPKWLAENTVDLAFNIAEGFLGEAREARVPALLELLDIPYTGSGVLTCALALDKWRAKQIFRSQGIPTPNFQIFLHPDDPVDSRLHFPLIVKPNCEGSGKGIWASSVVRDAQALAAQVNIVLKEYGQKILVEEFIEGTELTVGIFGNEALPVLEVDFTNCAPAGESFYSWRVKEFQGNEELHLNPQFACPARLDAAATHAVQSVALKATRALGCRDLARVDIRLSQDGIPYVLEVNPLPGLDPEESNIPIMVRAAGMSYEAFIHRIVSLAVERSQKLSTSSIPSFQTNNRVNASPRRRALPDSMEKQPGSPGKPALALEQEETRKERSKEEDLGR